MVGKFTTIMVGARIDIDVVVVENELVVSPAVEGVEVVRSHDDGELFVSVVFA